MNKLVLLMASALVLVFVPAMALANDVYFAQTSAGGGAGTSCATAEALSGVTNYKPLSNSLVVGAGANLTSLSIAALDSDKAGVLRPPVANWDAGAYQFAAQSSFFGGAP